MELTKSETIIADRARRTAGNEIDREALEHKIAKFQFFLPEGCNSTLCHLTMNSGHVIVGQTTCLVPNEAQDMAFSDALNRLYEMESYHRSEMLFNMSTERKLPC